MSVRFLLPLDSLFFRLPFIPPKEQQASTTPAGAGLLRIHEWCIRRDHVLFCVCVISEAGDINCTKVTSAGTIHFFAPLDSFHRTVTPVLKGAALNCQFRGAMFNF